MQSSAVALLYHQEFFKWQFKGGLNSSLPGCARLAHGCHPVSTATALLVEIIWPLSILIFGTHRFLLTQQSTHLKRNVVDSGIFIQKKVSEHVYGGRGEERYDFCLSVCYPAAPSHGLSIRTAL